MKSLWTLAGVMVACLSSSLSGQSLRCGPGITTLHTVPQLGDVGQIYIYDASGGSLTFKYVGNQGANGAPVPDALNWVVMIPSSGTTPQGGAIGVTVGWNPLVAAQLKPGGTALAVPLFTVGQAPALNGSCIIELVVPSEPNPAVQSVVNAASLQPLLSPGALVSIFGSHLTGPTLSTTYDFTASYPTVVAGTSVTFNGVAAPLLYLSPSQINAIVPFSLAGQTSVKVAVQRFDQTSATVTLPLQDTSPAIFTAAQGGSGLGAILQQGSNGQFSYNSPGNPAPTGAALEIFATGMGVWTPPAQSDVFLFGSLFKTQPVSMTIGGQPAKILYAGTLGTALSSWSVLQVNAVVPDSAGSGSQPVVLTIGNNDNSQQGVTIWLQ